MQQTRKGSSEHFNPKNVLYRDRVRLCLHREVLVGVLEGQSEGGQGECNSISPLSFCSVSTAFGRKNLISTGCVAFWFERNGENYKKELVLCQAKPIPEIVTTKKRHESCFIYYVTNFWIQCSVNTRGWASIGNLCQLFAHKQQKYTTY